MKIFQLENISDFEISKAFKDVVVIPTETVYGLAASIDNEYALKRIFSVKGRPSDNPVIVHIGSMNQLYEVVEFVPECYKILIEAFWPGPLTLVFQAKNSISSTICGRRSNTISGESNDISDESSSFYKTIAIRMPKHEKLRQIVNVLGVPLAAPSANTSGKPSPTNINHVLEDLGDKVPSYIDGGQCEYGLESTVFFYNDRSTDSKYILLRPGAVTKEQLEDILKHDVSYKNKVVIGEEVISPGTKYRHYSPSVPLYLFIGSDWIKNMNREIYLTKESTKIGLMLEDRYCNNKCACVNTEPHNHPMTDNSLQNNSDGNTQGIELSNCFKVFNMGRNIIECCRNCFLGLKDLEKVCDIIFVQGFRSSEEGRAFMDRIEKAADKIIE